MVQTSFSKYVLILLILGWATTVRSAQDEATGKFITASTPVSIQVDNASVVMQASLLIKSANNDDTVSGSIVFQLDEEARTKLARITADEPESIPSSIILDDISAQFKKGTSCPVIRLRTAERTIVIRGLKLPVRQLEFRIMETSNQIPQLFCAWTRQINTDRLRLGIITAINRQLGNEQ